MHDARLPHPSPLSPWYWYPPPSFPPRPPGCGGLWWALHPPPLGLLQVSTLIMGCLNLL